jgi:cell wall-associated NlpC family hydrolase
MTWLVGVPYKLGGRGPDGLDCWGLCMAYYRERGLLLGDVEYTENPATVEGDVFEVNRGEEWAPVDDPQDGDLVLFGPNAARIATHCGIYLAPGRVLHAASGRTSCITPWRVMRRWATAIYRYQGVRVCQS